MYINNLITIISINKYPHPELAENGMNQTSLKWVVSSQLYSEAETIVHSVSLVKCFQTNVADTKMCGSNKDYHTFKGAFTPRKAQLNSGAAQTSKLWSA